MGAEISTLNGHNGINKRNYISAVFNSTKIASLPPANVNEEQKVNNIKSDEIETKTQNDSLNEKSSIESIKDDVQLAKVCQECNLECENIENVESLDVLCIEWEGYVQKKGHLLRNWKTRYFTLEGSVLSYYETKEDARQRKKLKGRCSITQVKLDDRPKTAHGNDFVFETKADKHFHISAYTPLDRIVWIHMIEAGIDSEAMKTRNQAVYGYHSFKRGARPSTDTVYNIYSRILKNEPELVSEFLFYFNKDVVISSYYPRQMPFHGDFFGREGLLYLLATMKEAFNLHESNVISTSSSDDGKSLTIKGIDKMRFVNTDMEIEQPWTHIVRFDPYGSVVGIKIDIDPREAKGGWPTTITSNPYPTLSVSGVKTVRALSINLHDFTVFHVIGKGGFGTVVNAMKKSDGQIYALKILEKAQMTKYDVESSFTEMRIAQSIHHPFIAGLRIAFQSPTKLFLGMNYYAGGDLFHHMSKGATCRIAPARARFYTAELILGIHHLHQHDILYRDIKPENVMIDSDGHIALVDFGLAKLHVSNYQGAKTMAGSPQYTAPELLLPKGKRSYGKSADWWSLGILLYEMSIGKSPFYDSNVEKMYQKIMNDDVLFPPRPTLSDELHDIILGLLRKNPTERYGNKIQDLLEHPYFNGIDWDLLLQKKIDSPWKPKISSALDVGYVDPEFTDLDVSEEVSSPNKAKGLRKTLIEKIGIAKTPKADCVVTQDPTFKEFTYYCEDPEALVKVDSLVDELHIANDEKANDQDVAIAASVKGQEMASLPPIDPSVPSSEKTMPPGTPLSTFVEKGALDHSTLVSLPNLGSMSPCSDGPSSVVSYDAEPESAINDKGVSDKTIQEDIKT